MSVLQPGQSENTRGNTSSFKDGSIPDDSSPPRTKEGCSIKKMSDEDQGLRNDRNLEVGDHMECTIVER